MAGDATREWTATEFPTAMIVGKEMHFVDDGSRSQAEMAPRCVGWPHVEDRAVAR